MKGFSFLWLYAIKCNFKNVVWCYLIGPDIPVSILRYTCLKLLEQKGSYYNLLWQLYTFHQKIRTTIRLLKKSLFEYFTFPAGIYLLNVNNRNTRTRCEICSKLTIKMPHRRHCHCRLGRFNFSRDTSLHFHKNIVFHDQWVPNKRYTWTDGLILDELKQLQKVNKVNFYWSIMEKFTVLLVVSRKKSPKEFNFSKFTS